MKHSEDIFFVSKVKSFHLVRVWGCLNQEQTIFFVDTRDNKFIKDSEIMSFQQYQI